MQLQRRVKRQPRNRGTSHDKVRRLQTDAFPPSDTSSKAQLDSDFVLNDSSGEEAKLQTLTVKKSSKHDTTTASNHGGNSSVPGKGTAGLRTSPNGLLLQLPGEHRESQPTPGNSQSRVCISRGSLREIPKSELRLSGVWFVYCDVSVFMSTLVALQ